MDTSNVSIAAGSANCGDKDDKEFTIQVELPGDTTTFGYGLSSATLWFARRNAPHLPSLLLSCDEPHHPCVQVGSKSCIV